MAKDDPDSSLSEEQLRRMIVENRGNEHDLLLDIQDLLQSAYTQGKAAGRREFGEHITPEFVEHLTSQHASTVNSWLKKGRTIGESYAEANREGVSAIAALLKEDSNDQPTK